MEKLMIIISYYIFISISLFGQSTQSNFIENKQISIKWQDNEAKGTIKIINGSLLKIAIIEGTGKIQGNQFEIYSAGEIQISITIDSVILNLGSDATIVSILTDKNPFSFFLRDVFKDFPIYIPDFNVIVTSANENRSFSQIKSDIDDRGLQTKLQKINVEPEESYEKASIYARNSSNPTWLGLSRDIRIFEISLNLEDAPSMEGVEKIVARYPFEKEPHKIYYYNLGRGAPAELNISRWLEEGALPILHSTSIDEDIRYHSIFFVSLENSILYRNSNIGTDHMVADSYSMGTHVQKNNKLIQSNVQEFLNQPEETVLYFRTKVTNTGNTPRYAWFKSAAPSTGYNKWSYSNSYDEKTGFYRLSDNNVCCISKLNSSPMPMENVSILLKPGETISFEFYIPHEPISEERAIKLSEKSFDERYADCKKFWKEKLNRAARIHLPEKRIDEMVRAGLLHLDLITFGLEPDSSLATNVGRYCPIGTESSPIIQFYNSMGLHDIAKRSLMHFFDKQREDGFMQNYQYYMGETGAILWTAGEYYRYTNDQQWVKEIEPKLLKACDYLLKWRERNKIDSLQGKGYGMIEGSMADPVDPYRQFMLNGYSYLGIKRVSEMLSSINPYQSVRLKEEAEEWKDDIRKSFFNSIGYSPVIPLSDGTWCSTVPPWPETIGPRSLFGIGGGVGVDALLGPLYLVFCEVLEPYEPASKMMLKYHSELFYKNNSAFGQPYYSRHDWLQLKLGLIKPFLKTFYNTFPAHADRETYTFREGFDHKVNHKTHEEAWFLMQIRWMLYMEEGKNLNLLLGIPRKWLEDGKNIEANNVSSYFGSLSFKVSSHLTEGYIEATINCNSDRKPEIVNIRIPHPYGEMPKKITGGVYDAKTETIKIKSFNGKTYIKLEFM